MNGQSGRQVRRREGWAILAVLGFFVTALPVIFSWPAERILFQPALYQQALREQNAYASYPAWLGELLALGGERILPGSGAQVLALLDSRRYEQVVRQIFPQAWVQSQAEGLIEQFWAYFNFQADRFELLVDLRPVKSNLQGGGVQQIASTIVEGLPPCTVEELLAYALQALAGQEADLPLCRPPEELLGVADLLVGGLLRGAAAGMPDRLNLAEIVRLPAALAGERLESAWQGWFGVYRLFRLVSPWLPWLAIAWLVLVAAAAYRTWRGPLFWGGAALLLPGASGLIIVLLLRLWVSQAMPALVQNVFGELALGSLAVDLLAQVGRQYLTAAGWIAFALALLGAVLLVIGKRAGGGRKAGNGGW